MKPRQRNLKGQYTKRARPPNPRQLENTLHRIYYDIKNPVSFSSPYQLYCAAKSKISNLSLEDVYHWLSKQNAYTLHRDTQTFFPRRKVTVQGPKCQYQADLLFLKNLRKSNDRTRYLLTMIDCFSRFATAIPLQTKTANSTMKGLLKAFKNLGGYPKKLQTDLGTEFYNDIVSRFLRSHKIIHFSSFQKDIKCGMVERFNRTLRKLISMYLEANKTDRYIDRLPDILSRYNSAKHSAFSHQYAPRDINAKNAKKVYRLLYGDYLALIDKQFDFQVGDVVIKAFNKRSGIQKLTKTFDVIKYVIVDRIPTCPPVYKIQTLSSKLMQPGTWYAAQLQKIASPEEEES